MNALPTGRYECVLLWAELKPGRNSYRLDFVLTNGERHSAMLQKRKLSLVLVGLGFVFKGVPGAGLLALAVLLLGIMQLPVSLITIPVIAFVIATEGATTGTITFSIYVFVAGLVDNVLKPLLLGRGVDVPMPVILIGALGGMVTSGIIGLFIGPVVLAVGYQLFWQWVQDRPEDAGTI